jgi:hypothetical protein
VRAALASRLPWRVRLDLAGVPLHGLVQAAQRRVLKAVTS